MTRMNVTRKLRKKEIFKSFATHEHSYVLESCPSYDPLDSKSSYPIDHHHSS